MAILRNMWMRGAKQKIAGSVVYQLKGQTVQREQAASVSNPRTGAQMSQRLKLANLVAMYRANKSWMKIGAFENKPQTSSDYNAFVSANINSNSVALTKELAGMGACVLAPYLVTKGTLPAVKVQFDTDKFKTDLYYPTTGTWTPQTTIAEATNNILNANNGLREGDQLLIVICNQTSTNGVPYVSTRYYELILDSNDTSTLTDKGFYDSTTDALILNASQGKMQISTDASMCAATIVISREVSGKVHVSTQSLVLSSDALNFNATYSTSAARARARASYGASDNYVLNTNYAGDSNASVPLAQEIMLANGRAAGQPLSVNVEQGTQGKILGNIVLQMAQALSGSGYEATLTVNYPGNSYFNIIDATNVSVSGNLVTIQQVPAGDTTSTTAEILNILLQGPDGSFTISFPSAYNNGDNGEVTE